ncbi:MAG: hypothetical protein OEY00_06960 [Gammaproteobacteria bacterium]|nr:hypothetical protein [Gammaproteobacteria bacterium]
MDIDLDYLRDLLHAFSASGAEFSNLDELIRFGFDYTTEFDYMSEDEYEKDKFLHHMQILKDGQLISSTEQQLPDFFPHETELDWQTKNIQLTPLALKFIEAIEIDSVLKILKENSENEAFRITVDSALLLADQYENDRLDIPEWAIEEV